MEWKLGRWHRDGYVYAIPIVSVCTDIETRDTQPAACLALSGNRPQRRLTATSRSDARWNKITEGNGPQKVEGEMEQVYYRSKV